MGFKVLVVEDELALQRLIARALERAGYEVRTARLGHDAVTLLEAEQWTPDLVLTDLGLPDMNGLALLRWCRDRGSHVPFVLSTGDSALLATLDGRALGASLLRKPWDLRELATSIRQALAG
jgi:DNA-binding response OmpR family regulator